MNNFNSFLCLMEKYFLALIMGGHAKKINRVLLQKKGYYWIEEKRQKMKQNLDNIFLKASLTSQEVRTLHGVLNFLSKEDEKK